MTHTDPLAEMLRAQAHLQQRLGLPPEQELSEAERVDAIKTNVLALLDEAHEALHEAHGWKAWSQTAPSVTPAFADELTDIFTFLLNLWLLSDPEATFESLAMDIAVRYWAKHDTNLARVKEGY